MEIELEMPGDYGYVEYHIMIGEPLSITKITRTTILDVVRVIKKVGLCLFPFSYFSR